MRSKLPLPILLLFAATLAMPHICFSDDAFQIHMRSGSFDPKVESSPNIGIAALMSAPQASQYKIVQCAGPIEVEWRDAIERSGVEIISYVPDFAFLVRGNSQAFAKIQKMSFIRWMGPFIPAYKIEPELLLKTGEMDVSIVTFPGERVSSGVMNVVSLPERARQTSDGRYVFRSKLKPESLQSLAKDESVAWIEEYIEPKIFNGMATSIMRVNQARQDIGLYGNGQIVAVCDTGLDTGNKDTIHPDLRGRLTAAFAYGRVNDWSDLNGHGTHVAGSVLGSGVQSGSDPATHTFGASFAGSAPDAKLVFQSIEDSQGNLTGLNYSLPVIFQAAYDSGARIHSNSWGSDVNGRYTIDSFIVDLYCWARKDMLLVFAAGNVGEDADGDGVVDPSSLGSPASAKDCLAVGASESLRSTGGYQSPWGTLWPSNFAVDPILGDPPADNPGGMAAFSGRGPTSDGRIKPDIVAPGTNIISCRSSLQPEGWGVYDSNYMYMGGTSMAAPLVSGTAALVREYYVKKGLANPSAALLKATLANGAFDMDPGQYGTGGAREMTARPNSVEGWGRVDVASSLCLDAARSLAHVENAAGLTTGACATYTYTINSAAAPLRVTLAWTDAPGSTNVLKQLVNDLDLTITGPTGIIYQGNGKIDRTNNMEGVDIFAPALGVYTVKISAYNTPQGPQPFALVVSGGMPTTMITGTIKTNTGTPIAGVKVMAGNYANTTDSTGKYAIKLPAGNYTVVPAKSGWAFSPYSKAITVPSAGIAGVDFVASANSASISGVVHLNQPTSVASAHPYTATNTWTINGLPGANYTSVHFSSIDVEDGRDFVQILNANDQIITQYTGQIDSQTSVMVSGAVLKIRLSVNGANTSKSGFTTDWVQSYFAGISVTAQPGGAQSLTDAAGNFNIQGLLPISYTISPAKTGWAFDPTQKVITPTPGQTSIGTVFAGYTANQVKGLITTLSTSLVQQLTESPHPYSDNDNTIWTLNGAADTAAMRIHFNIIDTEKYFDLVRILDTNNNVIETYSGSLQDQWSPWVRGNALKVQIQADSSYSDYFGIRADMLEMESSVSSPKSGVTVSASPTKTALSNINGYYTLSGLDFGSYGIEPSLKSWSFTPPRKTVALSVGQTTSLKNFRAKAPGYITGKVVHPTINTGASFAESPHPYTNNYADTWTVLAPQGASGMRVHFNSIDMEEGYDYVAVCDQTGAIVQTYTGSFTDVWTDWIPGNYVTITMWTDSLNEMIYQGFTTDSYEYTTSDSGIAGATVTAAPSGVSATTSADGSYKLTLAEGDYTLTAKKVGAAFALSSRAVSVYNQVTKPGMDFYVSGFGPANASIAPSAGGFASNRKQTFTCKYTDPDGASDIANCSLLINASLSGINAANVSYDAVSNKLYLRNNTNTALLGGFAPGSTNIIENSQCILYCADTTTSVNGNERTVTFVIALKSTMSGRNCMAWMKVYDSTNLTDGWDQLGSNYKIDRAPTNTSITPNTGGFASNTRQTFTCKYADPDGASEIANCNLLINASLSGINAAYVSYDAVTNKLYVKNNTNTALLGGFAPGSANIIENSQCILYCADTTTSVSGNERTVTFVIALKSTMSGKNCKAWMKVYDRANLIDGWDQLGSNYKIDRAPTNTSFTPNTGALAINSAVAFTSSYADPDGYGSIDRCYLLIIPTLTGINAVYAIYDATNNKLYVRNDANTLSIGGFAPGSANIIENNQFKLYCADTTVSKSGTSITVNWKIALKQPMAGKTCKAWLQVTDKSRLMDKWEQFGSNLIVATQSIATTAPKTQPRR